MKQQTWIGAQLVAAAFTVLAAAPVQAGNAADPLKPIRISWEQAMLKGDAVAAAALFSNDAVQMRPGRPTNRGRDAIAAGYGEDFAAARVAVVKMTPSETRVERDTALEHGTFGITWIVRAEGAKPMDLHGRYLLRARRSHSGQWLIELEMHTIEPEVPETELR